MSERTRLGMALLWGLATIVAAMLDLPSGYVSMLPVLAVATLVPDRKRCTGSAVT